jgi:dTDP-4-dehydrorhamnose 3,5-epimerase-like enzyme
VKNVYVQTFKSHGSVQDGFLTAIERNTGLPFDIKRVYTVSNTRDSNVRGFHAHKTLWQIFFAVHGEIDVMTESPDGTKEYYKLDSPEKGLVCGPHIWHTITYHGSAILMVLASEGYSEQDYIRDYTVFRNLKDETD